MREAKPLDGITVLDLTTALSGPFATLLLGGLGAQVIKIENPLNPDSCRSNAPYLGRDGGRLARESDEDVSISAINRLRNKLGITLNLKQPQGREVFADLVRKADIVVENFSRGALDRMGAGYAFAREQNPKIIYCSLTGYGGDAEGPGKAMDSIIQALSGIMMTSGQTDDPPARVGVPIADLSSAMFCVIGVLAALHQRSRTGIGQHVDVSMLGAMASLVASEPFDLLERCGVPYRTGQTIPRLAPFGIYPTIDGFVAICAPQEGFAQALFRAIGRAELLNDARFATRDVRVVNVEEVDKLVEAFTSPRTKSEVLAILGSHGVPSAEVRDPKQAVADSRVIARGETVLLEHPKYGRVEEVYGSGIPIRFSGASAGFDQPPPGLGEHTEQVLRDLLGYTEQRIDTLRASGAI